MNIVPSNRFELLSKPYESSVRNQLYQLGIFLWNIWDSNPCLPPSDGCTSLCAFIPFVEPPRFELGTEACKATVFAIYTIAPLFRRRYCTSRLQSH